MNYFVMRKGVGLMKKLRYKVIAIILSIVFVFSVGAPSYKVSAEGMDEKVIVDFTVSAGIAAIRYFAPSGAVIAAGLQSILDSMFSGEALDKSRPYIERVILLGEYAYSINAQCLKAAQTVSQFTPEQVASLNDQELYNYKNVVSLTSIVNSQINDMCTHMYSLIREDSVVNHLETYNKMNRLLFLNYATESKNLSNTLRVGDLAEVGYYDKYNEVYDITSNDGILKYDELNALATHVRENYPGMTLREYLNSVGFNTDNLPKDTYIALAEPKCYKMDAFPDGGGIGFKCKYNVSSVSIDDSDVTVKDRDLVTIVSRACGSHYPEKLTDGYVTNFTEAK